MKRSIILLSTAAILSAGAAFAQPAASTTAAKPMHHGGHKMMEKMDGNKDGVITRAEALDAAGKHFDMMDTNKDGKVTKEEGQAFHEQMRAKWEAKKAARAANQTNKM